MMPSDKPLKKGDMIAVDYDNLRDIGRFVQHLPKLAW